MSQTVTPLFPRPIRLMADEKTRCRLCQAQIRVSYRDSFTASAWCANCRKTATYEFGATHTSP